MRVSLGVAVDCGSQSKEHVHCGLFPIQLGEISEQPQRYAVVRALAFDHYANKSYHKGVLVLKRAEESALVIPRKVL